MRKRYISGSYAATAERALKGVIEHITPEGELTGVSFGTAMGSELAYYRQIPRTSMPYGQAMAILCLAEYLRVYI
ncbi:Glycosyl Hydrolase Family 88 [compost metagenome]